MKKILQKILPSPLFFFLRRVKQHLLTFKRYAEGYLRLKLSLPLKKKRDKIHFEIHLAEHCNLNCAGCCHFSCIAEPELIAPEEFTRDMTRMGELFGHNCENIYLMGGEPLLHPDIISFMRITREKFPDSKMSVYTNGILLPKQGADFWTACHDYNVGIDISRYPIKLDVEAIEGAAEKYGVVVRWASAPKNILEDSAFIVSPIDLSGSGDIRRSFAMCMESNNCINLSHGRLFTCVFAAYAHHFAKKFGVDIPITEADYIDIYKESDADTILEKLTHPIPACRFCSGGRYTRSSHNIKWHHTEQSISEWM